ncbi:MAG: glycosyltransferase [Elusimicrobia bacterium]|nr:glycosyltransferase [Elusimicrobiota bacterium]
MSEGVSIIIPTYNGKELLKKNLPLVLEEQGRYKGESEVIVVDDGGADGTAAELPALFPGVRFVRRERNGGFAETANEGVKLARHPLVFLLNNDIELTPGVLEKLAGSLGEKDVFAVQAKIVTEPGSEEKDYLGLFSSRFGLFKYEVRPAGSGAREAVEMDFASGGASMFSREKFLALGLFDERFSPFYFEDLDLCFRARWFGWRILYRPDARVYHLHAGSTVKAHYSSFWSRVIHRRNYFLFLLKNTVTAAGLPLFLFYALYRTLTGGPAEIAGFLLALLKGPALFFGGPARLEKNILYLDLPLESPGGGQLSLLNIVKNLEGYRPFLVLAGPSSITAEFRSQGVPLRAIKAGKADILAFIPALLRILRSVRPGLIHCNAGTTFFSFVFALAARLRGIPFIWHNRVAETAGLREKTIALLATRIIVISDAVAAKFSGLAPGKVIKVHNAVDLEAFRPLPARDQLRKELGLDRSAGVIGIFSRLDGWKGHELFLAAARKISPLYPDCRFLIVGEGPERARLEALAREPGLAGKVLFTGYRKDIAALMNLCSVIVNPSILPEPFGRTIIEGMACGKPVIATNMGGPLEIIEDGADGFLAPPEPGAIAGLIGKLLADAAYAARIGGNARKKTERCFDLRAQLAGLYEVYKTCENSRK